MYQRAILLRLVARGGGVLVWDGMYMCPLHGVVVFATPSVRWQVFSFVLRVC